MWSWEWEPIDSRNYTHYAALHDRKQTLIDDHRAALWEHIFSQLSIRCLINMLSGLHISKNPHPHFVDVIERNRHALCQVYPN